MQINEEIISSRLAGFETASVLNVAPPGIISSRMTHKSAPFSYKTVVEQCCKVFAIFNLNFDFVLNSSNLKVYYLLMCPHRIEKI